MAGLATSLTFGLLTLALITEVMLAASLAGSWDTDDTDLSRAVSAGLLQLQMEDAADALATREKRFVGHHTHSSNSHFGSGTIPVSKSQLRDLCNRRSGRTKRNSWHRHLCQYVNGDLGY